MVETVHEVKAPCQQRSRDSQERILKAAEALIKSKGFEALTTAEVVRRSRTSIGTLYARFGDKTALLHAVQDRVQSREEACMRDAAGQGRLGRPLPRGIGRGSCCEIKQTATEGDDRLFEAFVVHGATDPVLRAQGYRHKAAIEELEVEILLRHAGEIGHADPEDAARVASRLAQAAQEEYVQRSLSGVDVARRRPARSAPAAAGGRHHRLSEEPAAGGVAASGRRPPSRRCYTRM